MKRYSVLIGAVGSARAPAYVLSEGPVAGQYPNEVLRYIQPSQLGPVLYLGLGGPKCLGTK